MPSPTETRKMIQSTPKLVTAISAATYTFTTDDCIGGRVFTTRGASADQAFTLPSPIDGADLTVIMAADQELEVSTADGDDMVTQTDNAGTGNGDLSSDSVTYTTANEQIGVAMRFVSDGVKWYHLPMHADGIAFAVGT